MTVIWMQWSRGMIYIVYDIILYSIWGILAFHYSFQERKDLASFSCLYQSLCQPTHDPCLTPEDSALPWSCYFKVQVLYRGGSHTVHVGASFPTGNYQSWFLWLAYRLGSGRWLPPAQRDSESGDVVRPLSKLLQARGLSLWARSFMNKLSI